MLPLHIILWLIAASILFFPSLFFFLKKKDRRCIIGISAGLFYFLALLIIFLFSQLLQINFYEITRFIGLSFLVISILIGYIIYWKMGGKLPTTEEWLKSLKTGKPTPQGFIPLLHAFGKFIGLVIMGIMFSGVGVYLLFMNIFWWRVIFGEIFWWGFWWGIIFIVIGISDIIVAIYFRKRTKVK